MHGHTRVGCMTTEDNRSATIDDENLSITSEYELCGWPSE